MVGRSGCAGADHNGFAAVRRGSKGMVGADPGRRNGNPIDNN